MNILWLVNEDYYKTKMSRVRFHSMKAVGNQCDKFVIFGPGWGAWNDTLSCQENIDNTFPKVHWDLVVAFKPLDMKEFQNIKYRKCLRYNEMYDKTWTIKEIVQSEADLVVCHHYNDYIEYKNLFSKVPNPKEIKFAWVPHSAEKTIFKPMPEIEKKYDVIIVGATNVQTMMGEHYPLRARMARLLSQRNKLTEEFKCAVIPHVGGSHSDAHTDKYAKQFAETINSAKIVITDAGAPKSRFGKYIEIPACGVCIAGDVYDDHPDDVKELKKFLIEINNSMKDEEIINKLISYLRNDDMRKVLENVGLEYASNYTHEKYAERFLKVI